MGECLGRGVMGGRHEDPGVRGRARGVVRWGEDRQEGDILKELLGLGGEGEGCRMRARCVRVS